MKQSPFIYIIIGTILLVAVTIMGTMNFDFKWIFYASLIGQAFVVFMVYKVLKDAYSTDKTFDDFYENHPIGKVELMYEEVKEDENYR